MEYGIEKRYEYYSRSGITWTKWFMFKTFDDKDEAEKELKRLKKTKEPIKKLRSEYRLAEEKNE